MSIRCIRDALNARSAAQLVTKFVPEGKIKSRPSGIVVGGACSCCEAGGRSIPRGSVTDYSSAKRKNSSGTSTSHNSAAATRKVSIHRIFRGFPSLSVSHRLAKGSVLK